MAILSNADFYTPPGKKADKGPFAGISRYDIVDMKISQNLPFILGNDDKGEKVKGIKFDRATKMFTYQTKDRKTVTVPITGKRGNIFKDSDFGGGGGGAGLGTVETAYAESLQCMYCAIIVSEPDIALGKINKTKLQAAYRKVFVSSSFDQCFKLAPIWHASAYYGAKKLLADGFINSNQTFHRDDAVMNKIYSNANKAFRNTGLDNMKPDKWNPGDIWAKNKNFDINSLDTTTIKNYNTDILKAYQSRALVGISLKKIEKEKNLKIAEINTTNARPEGLQFSRVLPSGKTSRASFYSSKGGQIEFKKRGAIGIFEVRANSAFGTLKAEIAGKTARQGGAGWGPLRTFISTELSPTYNLPTNDILKNNARMIHAKNAQKLNEFWLKAKTIDSTLDEKEFKNEIPKKDLAWIHAKLGVTYLLYAIHKNKQNKKAHAVINNIYNYAGSQSKLSSVHLKVYE